MTLIGVDVRDVCLHPSCDRFAVRDGNAGPMLCIAHDGLNEPLVCTCAESDPEPYGECRSCHRLALSHCGCRDCRVNGRGLYGDQPHRAA